MVTLQEMIAQKVALEQKIEEATAHGRNEAIAQVKAMMAEHGLKTSDLGCPSWPLHRCRALARTERP